mmetsp:Transcript_13106/g.37692  ORF Transcript_13106/g.37692 Transcript_13106/m.37692 type:complete len:664 (+) Transcript_13106:62-2053(+)
MGSSLSTTRVWGVPMPPAARSLVAVWSEVWEAPRFGGQASLRREDVAPLLKIAASCAAILQGHVAPRDRKSRLPPQGASRELLVMALDLGCEAAGLPRPADDPEGFVRALVRACFTTGDGDLEGVDAERLDALLAEHCSRQLELAAALIGDSCDALRTALESATAQVQKVLAAAPPKRGDLSAAAGRLLLAQRLERIAEEATELIAAEAARAAAMETEVQPATVADAETTSTEAGPPRADEAPALDGADTTAGEELPTEEMDTDQPMPRSKTIVSSAAVDEEAKAEMPRTRSQIASSVKVQKVRRDIDEKREPIHDLRRAASQLAQRPLPEDADLDALESELQVVEQARKRARNFHEDLLEDMLALDNLQNLAAEDRSTRKASLVGIEALLDDVDAAKTRLAALHKDLQEKLEAARKAKEEATAAAEAEAAAAAAAAAKPVPGAGGSAREGRWSKRAALDALSALEAPPPQREDWQKVRLPLRFHSREEADHYTILATIPGLDTDELKLELSDDCSKLTVVGLRAPTEQEAAWMQRKISARLRSLAQESPQRIIALQQDIGRIASRAYMELGQGEFGRFSEIFRIPEDVDTDGIEASYRDGVLRVVLPKVAVPPPQGPWFDNGRANFSGARRGAAPAGFPGFRQGRVRSPSDLFGGLDGSYYW